MDASAIVLVAIAGLTALLAVLLGTLVWAMVMQRQSLTRQRQNLFQIEESLELSRRGVVLSERLLRLAEQSLGNQEEVIRLLKALAGRAAEEAAPFGGVRLPGPGAQAPGV